MSALVTSALDAAGSWPSAARTLARAAAASVLALLIGVAAAQCVERPDLAAERFTDAGDAACVTSALTSDGRTTTEVDLAVPAPGTVHELRLEAAGSTELELCVIVAGETSCRQRDADAVVYGDLRLDEATVRVRVSLRGTVGATLRVALESTGAVSAGFAYEPNDAVATAAVLGDDLTVRGRFDGREVDVLAVDVDGDPQLWRVQVLGDTVDRVQLLAASGRVEQTRTPAAGERGVRMSNLYLLPGRHYLSVRGTDGDYALRMIPLGPADEPPAEAVDPAAGRAPADARPAPPRPLGTPTAPRESAAAAAVAVERPLGPRPPGQMEREPNDDERTASLLRPGEPWVGLLSEADDVDVYRFFLGDDGPIRLTVTPPADLGLHVRIDGGSRQDFEPGETVVIERRFLAGDHTIALSPRTPVDGYYQVLLERVDPFQLGDLPQPHDEWWRASPLPVDHEIRARVDRTAHVALPHLPRATTLDVAVLEGTVAPQTVVDDTGSTVARFVLDRDRDVYVAELPAGGPYVARFSGGGHDVHVRFTFDDDGPRAEVRGAPPSVELTLEGPPAVAAYHPYEQRFALAAEARNVGDAPLVLHVETATTDHGWRLTPREARLELAPGASQTVTFDVRVAPLARDDLPVDLTVALRADDGGVVSATAASSAICGVPLQGGAPVFAVPDAMLGGVNLAWVNLGAAPLDEGNRHLTLYDGLTPPGYGWLGGVDEATTVRLAGDGTPRVVGVMLHPLSAARIPDRLADFEVQTSVDGVTFTTALQGRLRAVSVEQPFVFDAPVAARYVRLVARSNQDGNPRTNTGLGQFKVIATPGERVLGDRVDLGRREHGGHVAAALPWLASYELTEASTRASPTTVRIEARDGAMWWVQAFHHNRAALLDGLVWHPHPGSDGAAGERIEALDVAVSLDGPLGPWTELGTWRVGQQPEWRFEAPTWARYVRFEASFADLDRPTVVLPDRVGVLEHPEGPDYRSVLGEWGHYGRDAAYEWRHPPRVDPVATAGAHATRELAAIVRPDDPAAATVLVAEYDAWFAFDVPADQNHVTLELRGDPTVDYLYELVDERGRHVVGDVLEGPERVTIEAFLDPGRYYVRAWEPLRNVVFSWDDSGSMGPYVDATLQTVFGFARDVDATREVVQLQVFARLPYFLLDDWTGAPIEVLRSVLSYPRDEGSSDLERNLAFVVEELAQREGTRAVFLVSDAESGPSALNVGPLWESFVAAPPVRVFAFETSSAGSDDTQDRMQTYADVAGGFYDYSRTLGDLDVAFARASCLLRQPKTVRVALALERRAPPGPGALAVRTPTPTAEELAAATPAVHVIYDASGSMGQLLTGGGATRLEVARRVLTDLVSEVIDPGTPFALRAYGHVAPMTCDTALVHPLAPLDPAAARAAVASVEPKLLSQTPLAASIAAVAADLREARGPKTVVLLTDGEETCGGDPEAAIRDLVAAGEVTLSIVGFDVDADDEAAMRARFAAWAALGGGTFVEAFDADALRDAMIAALDASGPDLRFEVLDADGRVVAEGVVDGASIELPGGRYAVRFVDAPERDLDAVDVRPEATTTLTLERD